MKAIATVKTVDQARRILDALNLRGLYGCFSGCKSRGYEVLVRDATLGTANEVLKSFNLSPEVTH